MRITHNTVRYHLGSFAWEEQAARAYDEAARQFYGEYAWLNYIPGGLSIALMMAISVLVKLQLNHLVHLRQDVKEIRRLLIEHLRDHGVL